MNIELVGSGLTCAMLDRGDEQVWCAVSNDSDEHAMATIDASEYDFLIHIVSFDDTYFFCKEGVAWQYAVPIKKTKLTQDEVGL